ncbi:MAG: hypothetical protein HFJ30_10450 [Clostridia bacterium]|jgi:hypothetical protein|nr:hypothetical protein [Clostridia bacterium]
MEDVFDKDITVINKYIDKETRKPLYKVSHIKGFWSSNDGISINGTQITKSDGLSARILINDSRNEQYQSPEEFEKEQNTWTLKPDDCLIKGFVCDVLTTVQALEKYGSSNVIKITNIATKDYGSENMQHFVVTGA